tara:strand:- start:90229 stop:90540 length:312 start_codon:yes stop_codon:yes gene_type:complete
MGDYKKCGISLEYNEHDESTCDFIPIDWDNIEDLTHVDNIEIEVSMKLGYGIWEISIIYDIMKRIWNKSDKKNKIRNYLPCGSSEMNLFYEAEKEFLMKRDGR